MRVALRSILLALLFGPLLAACSLGADEATPAQESQSGAGVARPAASARSVTLPSGTAISGRLLFVEGGNLILYQGERAQQLTSDGMTRDPAWSPDGTRIAYVRREESFADIYLLDVRGGLPTQITFNGSPAQPRSASFIHQVVWAAQPAWTPDGAQLVFLSQVAPPSADPLYEYPLAIFQYDLDLVGQRQPTNADLLVQADNIDVQAPAWSPDGTLLAYVSVPRDSDPQRVMLFDATTGQASPFPGIPDNTYDPAWSPDGRWLAFAARSEGRTDIWAIPSPALGGAAVRLTSSGDARAPAWSPDGGQLALVQVTGSGSNVQLLTLRRESGTLAPGQRTPLTTSGQIDAASGLSWAR